MAPQVGAQLGQTIANYPKDYFEGQQRQRQLAVMNAFPDGVPVDPQTGGPDLTAVMSKLSKAGGGQYVQQLMPFLIQQQVGQQAGKVLSGADDPGASQGPPGINAGPGTSSAATGPANLTPRPQTQQLPQQGDQPLSSAGMDNNGAPTLRQIFSEGAGGRDVTTQILSAGRTLRLNPDAPLTPAQVQGVKNFRANAVGLSDGTGQPPTQVAQAGPQEAPQQPQEAPQRPPSNPALDAQVAQQTAQMNGLNSTAARVETYAASIGAVNPATASAALAKAKAIREQASAIQQNIFKLQQQGQEAQLKEQESTPEMKNATRGAAAIDSQKMRQKQNELDAESFSKVGTGLQAAGNLADKMVPQLQLAKSLMKMPGFMSGAGAETNLAYKQWLARFSPKDANTAMPQEAFHKVVAANLLDQIGNLKAEMSSVGGAGRIFQAEIEMMEKAAQNLDYTPASNRLLTEIGMRTAQRTQEINRMALQYGPLDRNFMLKVQDYNEKHPLFTPDELKDPRRIAPPEFDSSTAAARAKLPYGSPVLINGQLKFNWAKGS